MGEPHRSTTNGSTAAQSGDTGGTTPQWIIEPAGSYVRIKNRATGLYLDGMGRTSNGAGLAQDSDSGSTNQQWNIVAAG
ncbi:RICIN domain-containing protein [Microbispora sitophila]|uniref:RICIN domain-containing protein n=1 Tax=Microbispora sitophila TaxID=2771537 RepID=UPI00299F6504|nr:RICIN domain-containing protein [Microbispora sitophila]